MNIFLHLPPERVLLSLLAVVFASLVAAFRRIFAKGERRWSEASLLRYSNLQLFTATLFESRDPKQIVKPILDHTLQLLSVSQGCLLLQGHSPQAFNCQSARGFSSATLGRLSAEPLWPYLCSSAERWGSLMLFPDLQRPDLLVASQRDPLLQEFRSLMAAEGLRTMVVVGLQVKERPYGALILGSQKPRTFYSGELRLMLAIGQQISVALENYYLRRTAERHQEDLRVLQRIEEALSATIDLDAQVQILRRELQGILGTTNLCVTLQDPIGGSFESVCADGQEGCELHATSAGLAEYVLKTRRALLISEDPQGTARRLGFPVPAPVIRTWCGVPIHFSDGSLGVLAVADLKREHALDERQFEFLQVLVGGAAVAIENARLLRREKQRARHLALLNDLGHKAAMVLDPKELLLKLCPQIRAAFGYDLVRLETQRENPDESVVEAEEGYGVELLGHRFKLGQGFSGIAAQTGEPVLSNDVTRDPRYIALDPRIRSALSLPLKYGAETLGVLSLGSFKQDGFSKWDVFTLQTLADQISVALHNTRAYQVAKEQAILDGLTGLKTHRFFMEALEGEWRRGPRSGRPFSLIMIDLDSFKPINDRYGHLEGDKVLIAVARLLESKSRQSSVVARYGGDEFAVLLPDGATDQAETLAERLRTSLAADPYLSSHKLTASFGIATFPVHGATPEEVLRVADSGMYLAKHEKGDRVRVAAGLKDADDAGRGQQLIEAYLGVAVKRMFATGPDVFDQYFRRFEQATENARGETLSLLDTVTALAFAIDAKDHYTQGHSQAVSRLSAQIARQIGMTDPDLEEIRLAGILHDIGKIGIPESVLNKPDQLTRAEFEIMQTHAALGWKILEPLKVGAIDRIRGMVRHHHERFDGRGYPDGLRADQIPLGARILAIADSYDTMVSERAYKKGRTVEEAIAELRRCRGGHFDARLVDAFFSALGLAGESLKQPASVKALN